MRLLIGFIVGFAAFAQQYEMDNYVVGLLKKGPSWSAERTPESAKLQEGHMANIRRMAELGKLIVAGPFTANNDTVRGLYIFKTTLEEAKQLAEADPAVKAGRLVLELYPWYAAKGLSVPPPK
jgi:uncharacterized protein YciI